MRVRGGSGAVSCAQFVPRTASSQGYSDRGAIWLTSPSARLDPRARYRPDPRPRPRPRGCDRLGGATMRSRADGDGDGGLGRRSRRAFHVGPQRSVRIRLASCPSATSASATPSTSSRSTRPVRPSHPGGCSRVSVMNVPSPASCGSSGVRSSLCRVMGSTRPRSRNSDREADRDDGDHEGRRHSVEGPSIASLASAAAARRSADWFGRWNGALTCGRDALDLS
jgi:hypothetical protein